MAVPLKIGGHHIEPAAIVAVLRRHISVRQAAVMVSTPSAGDDRLIAYVVPSFDAKNDDDRATSEVKSGVDFAHTAKWRKLLELANSRLKSAAPKVQSAAAGALSSRADFNLAGWMSSYTNRPVPEAEMDEWVNETVRRIQSLHPQRALEVGCGTGLLLFPIAPKCEAYWASDISQSVTEYIQRHIDADPALKHVNMRRAEACDFEGVPQNYFDVVILNSVIQYFPGVAYLADVIAKASLTLRPGGVIFLGDVRDFQQLEAFHLSVLLQNTRDDEPIERLRSALHRKIEGEPELAVAPALFPALLSALPRDCEVILEPRRGRAHNEMTRFRYNALIRVDSAHRTTPVEYQDWRAGGWTMRSLQQVVAADRPELLAFDNIPNARTMDAVTAVDVIPNARPDLGTGEFRKSLAVPAGIDPQALWDLEGQIPYSVHLRCGTEPATFQAIFRRGDSKAATLDADFIGAYARPQSATPQSIDWERLANDPARKKRIQVLTSELNQLLASSLSKDMIPAQILVVDQLPQGATT